MVRDAQSRLHVQRVETHCDLVALLCEWKARQIRDIDTFIALARALSPDMKTAA